MRKATPGIRVRHSRDCPTRNGGSCTKGRRDGCTPGYEAWVWSPRDSQKIRRTFGNFDEAKGWRAEAATLIRKNGLAPDTRLTVREAALKWIDDAKKGQALTRSGDRYKPSLIRIHESDLIRYVLPDLGAIRLSHLRRRDVQAFANRLVGLGLSGSRVRGIVMPLRVICRCAIENDEIAVNPTANVRLPAANNRRDRIADPAEALSLLEALPEEDRALWATAFYAGLRRGELRALRVDDMNEARTVITVSHGWDDVEGEIAPKSKKGLRTVPISGELRLYLLEHLARTGRRGSDFVFGRGATEPFTPSLVRTRAKRAWAAAGVDSIRLHECRHTYVSLMHAAGLSLERIGDYVGHSSAYMTDHYRHLLEGHEAEAAKAQDDFLAARAGARSGAHAAQTA